MTDAIKRIGTARTKQFQDMNEYYIRAKATSVLTDGSPDTDDLKLAKAVYSRTVNREDIAMIAVDNSTIGAAIDEGNDIQESWVEYVWVGVDSPSFHNLAVSMVAAGLIS